MPITRTSVIVLLVLAMVACAARTEGGTPPSPTQELTPPSELALLMRAMAVHADSVKVGLARDAKELPPFPEGITKLLTATPTKDMHIDPITYPTFGKDYQAKVNALYKAARKDRPAAYNALVQSCANCHSTHCPGPMMRIKKMYVKAGS